MGMNNTQKVKSILQAHTHTHAHIESAFIYGFPIGLVGCIFCLFSTFRACKKAIAQGENLWFLIACNTFLFFFSSFVSFVPFRVFVTGVIECGT